MKELLQVVIAIGGLVLILVVIGAVRGAVAEAKRGREENKK
jgi:hypothetical protein